MRYCVKNISVYIAKYTINCTILLKNIQNDYIKIAIVPNKIM